VISLITGLPVSPSSFDERDVKVIFAIFVSIDIASKQMSGYKGRPFRLVPKYDQELPRVLAGPLKQRILEL
jgi:hypothetical protein